MCCKKSYNIYKDPVTDDGTKKSLKGLLHVNVDKNNEYVVYQECSPEGEAAGLLQVIYEDGEFYNQTTLTEIRNRLNELI
jgi:nicotinamide phosphoribosyltransferase